MKLTHDLKGLASELIYPFVKLQKMQTCENCTNTERLIIWGQCRQCYIDSLHEMETTYKTTSHLIGDDECMTKGRAQHTAIRWREICEELATLFITYQDNQLRRIEEDIRSLFT